MDSDYNCYKIRKAPVFCDIDKDTFNIDAAKIEELINPNTVADNAYTCIWQPCNIKDIQKVASKYNLPVIYDAAHAVGSQFDSKSVLNFGDISATSFHATKIINSGGEGGGIITSSDKLAKKIKVIRFFGYNETKTDVLENGMNGKLSEIQSALGILNLKALDKVINHRKEKYLLYYNNLRILIVLGFNK